MTVNVTVHLAAPVGKAGWPGVPDMSVLDYESAKIIRTSAFKTVSRSAIPAERSSFE
jgi:hypothetical protein